MMALTLSILPITALAQSSEGYYSLQQYYDAHFSPFWLLPKSPVRYYPQDTAYEATYVTPTVFLGVGGAYQAGWMLVDGDPVNVMASGDPPVFTGAYSVTAGFHHWVGWFVKGSYDANNLPSENVPVFYNSVVPILFDKVSEDEF